MRFEGGVWEYSKNFSLNERLLTCAIYKVAQAKVYARSPIWRALSSLRFSGLFEALDLSTEMIANAQLSKSVWENMSKENKKQIFYSLIDLKDLVRMQVEEANDAFVRELARMGMTKEKFADIMLYDLDMIMISIEQEVREQLGTFVSCNVKERSVLIL